MKIDINRLGWLALGAGSKGAVAGMVSGVVEGAGILPDIGTAVVGFIVAQQGGQRVGAIGEGKLIASAGQIVRGPIEKFFTRIRQGNRVVNNTTTEKTTTQNQSLGSTTEALIAQKYGISMS